MIHASKSIIIGFARQPEPIGTFSRPLYGRRPGLGWDEIQLPIAPFREITAASELCQQMEESQIDL